MPLDTLFNNLLSSPSSKGALSGAASGALVSVLLNKKARKSLVGGAARIGGMAALAGVGYYAYKQWQKQTPASSQPTFSTNFPTPAANSASPAASLPPPETPPPAVSSHTGLKMMLAMVAAASADGHLDQTEQDTILRAIDQAGLSPEENAAVIAALHQPPTAEAIAQGINDPEVAAEIYGAARQAIELDSPAETLFLRRLAQLLKIDPALAQTINQAS